MSRTESTQQASSGVTIARVEWQTGLSKDTLRVWERRYGFPAPARDARGERLYPSDQVEKLRIISRLLDRGLRPGRLVGLPLGQLARHLEGERPGEERASEPASASLQGEMEEAIALLGRCDEAGLRTLFSRLLSQLGLQRFVIEFVANLNERIGDAWSSGRIVVAQEHLYSEQMQSVLRQGIGALYPAARGPWVLLTTLPAEQHQLGVLMAQACLAIEGARCVSLGAQTPAWDIAHVAEQHGFDVIGLSFSEAFKLNVAQGMLEDLRARVPPSIEIWAGGRVWKRARRPLPGVRLITELTQIPEALAAIRRRRAAHRVRDVRSHA